MSSPLPPLVACDDGVVKKLGRGAGRAIVACVSWSLDYGPPGLPSSVLLTSVEIDGLDATSIVAAAALELSGPGNVLLLDSVTIGGFNVVSPGAYRLLTRGEVIIIYTRRPRLHRILVALEKSGSDLGGVKRRVIEAVVGRVTRVETARGHLYIYATTPLEEAVKLVTLTQAHARKPEPLRVAHYTASAASRVVGEEWRPGT